MEEYRILGSKETAIKGHIYKVIRDQPSLFHTGDFVIAVESKAVAMCVRVGDYNEGACVPDYDPSIREALIVNVDMIEVVRVDPEEVHVVKQIKMFTDYHKADEDITQEVNNWISENDIDVVDIKVTTNICSVNTHEHFTTIMVIYTKVIH